MKYPLLLLLALTACNQPSTPKVRIMGNRKAAIFKKIFYDVPTLVDLTPTINHPVNFHEKDIFQASRQPLHGWQTGRMRHV